MGRLVLAGVMLLAVWTLIVAAGARNAWLRPEAASAGDAAGFVRWATERYERTSKGNIAIVVLERGQPVESFYGSHGRAVDGRSLFQVASLSKWFTAWGVMALVQDGRVDLDAPVSRYLKRWQLPAGKFDNDAATVRRVLAHSAGLTDGLGFLGFAPGVTPPSLVEELNHVADAMPGADGVVRVGAKPGSTWRYSGGGYLILQMLIEDVTGEDFNTYMRRAILGPLDMADSTFVAPAPDRLADIFAADGTAATHYTFTATGAASLYTSAADLTRFLQAQMAGVKEGHGVLSAATLAAMRKPEAKLLGLPVWGLGETLYAPARGGGFVVGHDGGNFPAINTTARIDPATGDGLIVLSTGNATLAREIGSEWTVWQTGKVSWDALALFEARTILIVFGAGVGVILIGVAAAFVISRRGARKARA